MSAQLIQRYYKEIDELIQYGGSDIEAVISHKFGDLIDAYCQKRNLKLIPQLDYKTKEGKLIRPDGTIKNALRIEYGFWESKANVNLDEEIRKKFNSGYPKNNILFEDGKIAILFQQGEEIKRANIRNELMLDKLLTLFISFEHAEVRTFNEAIEQFKKDIPHVVEALIEMIGKQQHENKKFLQARNKFHQLCKDSINPIISVENINEMLIQHILTEEIFTSIFSDNQFIRENNIAKALYEVEETFFTGTTKRQTLDAIKNYYEAIKHAASGIANHHEKQRFLKALYENFYKAYNPKAADRLGVVYTPNEIVKFQIESVDFLLHKYFGKGLANKNVEILDPATGTGTYICDLIEYIPKQYLEYKYKNEIHANELAILPYYIANLNIEYTYRQKMGIYEEFNNICFVDTLDNLAALGYEGKQGNIFGFSSENAERIMKQNQKKISVIIGNPPYNANQQNENDNNKNREYKEVDKRIKDTYIKYSTAQKTKLYDMYSRFFRWASDRLPENGILAYITNRSFIYSRTFDGFRKVVASEFNYIYIVDLGGDIRSNSKLSGPKHNVFAIQTGVAIIFLVKKNNVIEVETKSELNKIKRELKIVEEPVVRYKTKTIYSPDSCEIYYYRRPEFEIAKEKLNFLLDNKLENIAFEKIIPDKNNNWINLTDNDFETFIPLCSKDAKAGKNNDVIFEKYSTGISTNRDEWLIDFSKKNLNLKMRFFTEFYDSTNDYSNTIIKWSRNLKQRFERGLSEKFQAKRIINFNYRPFVPVFLYHSDLFIDEHGITNQLFCCENIAFAISGNGSSKMFQSLAINNYASLDLLEKTQCLSLFRYDKAGNRLDNITDWGLEQFVNHYIDVKITKEDIFHYTYGVLHNPAYRKKYEMNLKREFPRIPFYDNFWKWATWGKELMKLHINYETVEPYKLRVESEKLIVKGKETDFPEDFVPKAKLKADKYTGEIILDELTTITGVPQTAWEYKLGSRSALEWILDQYKESSPSDPTIREKFNTYKFADYKEQVIDLLKRVCTVSVRTVEIMKEMDEE